jgi:hypothetical protein
MKNLKLSNIVFINFIQSKLSPCQQLFEIKFIKIDSCRRIKIYRSLSNWIRFNFNYCTYWHLEWHLESLLSGLWQFLIFVNCLQFHTFYAILWEAIFVSLPKIPPTFSAWCCRQCRARARSKFPISNLSCDAAAASKTPDREPRPDDVRGGTFDPKPESPTFLKTNEKRKINAEKMIEK